MSYEAMLEKYQQKQNSTGTKTTFNSEENLKNYFTTWIPDNIKSKFKTFRILPSDDGLPFKEVKGHSIQINGKWTKFMCPKDTDGKPCPFCEAREALRASGTDTDKEIAKKYNQKEMYVIKLIDREKEDEGPKFFRFNHDYTNQGILDKIMAIIQSKNTDITDPLKGRDLTLDIKRDQNNRPVVNAVMAEDPSPLHSNETIAKGWLADDRTWRDVYKAKEYDYLEIVVNGEIPVWDKENKKYVAKATLENSTDTSESTDTNELLLTKPKEVINDSLSQMADTDGLEDLPF